MRITKSGVKPHVPVIHLACLSFIACSLQHSFDKKTVWSFNLYDRQTVGVPDRCAKKFFTAAILRPAGGTQFPAVSQKIMSATAARYLTFWLSSFLRQITCSNNDLYTFLVWYYLLCSGLYGFPILVGLFGDTFNQIRGQPAYISI